MNGFTEEILGQVHPVVSKAKTDALTASTRPCNGTLHCRESYQPE